MKKQSVILLIILLAGCQQAERYSVTFTNTLDLDRPAAGIEIAASEIEALRPVNDSMLPVLSDRLGEDIPCQLDDLDGDGRWDVLFTVLSLGPSETKEAIIRFTTPAEYPQFTAGTNIRFADKKNNYTEVSKGIRQKHAVNTITNEFWQMEGIAFENEYVGFRNYFDRRNAMDIFGKLITDMVLDSVGYAGYPDYHAYNPAWGMDVLKVGSSLGSGGIAYRYNDTLFRVGDNGLGTCDIITEGPLRSVFRLDYIDWSLDGTLLNVVHEVQIQSGTHYFSSNVTYEGIGEDIDLVAGIVNMKSDRLHELDAGDRKVFYTHDIQAEDTTVLGMAVMIPANDYAGHFATPDSGDGITQTYCVGIGSQPGIPSAYRFYSAWERQDPEWRVEANFSEFLKLEGLRMQEPVLVKLD